MSELRELYQETLLDHGRRPRNFGETPDANAHAEGDNPVCGDRLSLWLRLHEGQVQAASFQGSGCAIAMASASMMTEAIRGRSVAECEALFAAFRTRLTSAEPPAPAAPELGKLIVFDGVRAFPVRIKCATLAWHTLHAALSRATDPVSLE
jgi:nitrogen fixation NifU-like protein